MSLADVIFLPAAGGRVRILGVTLVGVTAETGLKLLFTIGLVIVVMAIRRLASILIRRLLGGEVADPHRFWACQGAQVIAAVVLGLGVLSIWITPHTNLTTGIGLISAGLAFALRGAASNAPGLVWLTRGS